MHIELQFSTPSLRSVSLLEITDSSHSRDVNVYFRYVIKLVLKLGRIIPARRSDVLITVRAREDNEDLSVSNSSFFESSTTFKVLSGNRPSSRVSSYAKGILSTLGLWWAVRVATAYRRRALVESGR